MMRSSLPHRGFTLTEMVVVIAIVVMLAGLTMAVLPAIMGQSDVRRTSGAITLVDTALKEWETTSERKLRWGTDGVPVNATYELQENYGNGPDSVETAKEQMKAMLRVLERNQELREMLSGIESDMLRRLDPDDATSALRVVDPWSQPLVVIHPGRAIEQSPPFNDDPDLYPLGDTDADGTIRTELENVLGICLNRQVCIVSAGPDGKYGNLHLDTAAGSLSPAQQDDVDDAADNIYSYEIGKDRP